MSSTSVLHGFIRLALSAVMMAVAATTGSAQQGSTYEIVSSFEAQFLAGRAPSSLSQANDSTFYGTTRAGGTYDRGTVFRMDAGGVVTPVYDFTGGPDGAAPFSLVKASDGTFYGLTSSGAGTVFRFVPGSAPTTVHAFSSQDDGFPADLFAASDGNVYGLTRLGGDVDTATIFMLDPGGGFSTIYSFPAGTGSYTLRSLVKASDGRFYITDEDGGSGYGAILSVDEQGALTVLHAFAYTDRQGYGPIGLIQGRDGRLYGSTTGGGDHSDGTVYSIGLTGDYRILHSFELLVDGSHPGPDLLEASDGNFYGVTTVRERLFRIDPAGTTTILRDFSAQAPGALIQAADGRVFGTTQGGGVDGGGLIYAVPLSGGFTSVYEFRLGDTDGSRPNGVIQASNGQFYGTTRLGNRGVSGTVFTMDGTGARTTLHTFQIRVPSVFEGTPLSPLVEANDGNLYGTTFNQNDTVTGTGQIFRLSPAGTHTRLSGEWWLRAGLIQARDGRLYGTSSFGIINGFYRSYGSVFRIEANGTRTDLHTFNGTDSAGPSAELLEVDDGSLYGTTAGGSFQGTGPPIPEAIFRIDPATGSITIRHVFSGPDGSASTSPLIRGNDGLLYGTTSRGGANGLGTVFSFDTATGRLTTLHHFAGSDGANPGSGLVLGQDGRLYGVTPSGGAFGYGTVFVMNTTGGLTTLHHFALSDGANPTNELIQANDGSFYGAALTGGPNGGGVIFRVRLETAPPPTDGYFEIVSRNSGKCLDISGGSTDAGAPAIQWACHGGPNQQWRLEPAGGGASRLVSRNSGQALDVSGASVDDLAPIIQWPVTGGANQAWTLEPASDGYVRLVVRHSGKAMDLEFGSTDDGARAIQYTPHGGANQQWLLRPVAATAPTTTVSQR